MTPQEQRIRTLALQAGIHRHAARTTPAPRLPITDGIQVHSVRQACHDLFMAAAGYYLDRASRGLSMSREVSALLLALRNAVHDDDGENRMEVLGEALAFFGRSVASVEDKDVRDAIRAARLTHIIPQDSLEMPMIKSVKAEKLWLYD